MRTIKLQLGGDAPQQICSKPSITYEESGCLETTFNTGFNHNDKPVIDNITPTLSHINTSNNKDSILDSVDTGFGENNKLIKDCPKPQYKTHLCKENYLGEFTKETEKALVRNNIGVYSKNEVREVVSHIISDSSLITRSEVQNIVEDLDFVDSVVRSHASYNIPNDLFQL